MYPPYPVWILVQPISVVVQSRPVVSAIETAQYLLYSSHSRHTRTCRQAGMVTISVGDRHGIGLYGYRQYSLQYWLQSYKEDKLFVTWLKSKHAWISPTTISSPCHIGMPSATECAAAAPPSPPPRRRRHQINLFFFLLISFVFCLPQISTKYLPIIGNFLLHLSKTHPQVNYPSQLRQRCQFWPTSKFAHWIFTSKLDEIEEEGFFF